MKRLQEILQRKNDIKAQVETLNDVDEIRKLSDEVDALNQEENDIRQLLERKQIAEKLENNQLLAKEIKKEGNDNKMPKRTREEALSSKEYRSAWAKAMMGLKASDENYSEEEIRAIGDAIGTTDTEFTAATESAQGINNLGLLVPTTVNTMWLEITEQMSPIYRDITKLNVDGNIDLTYLFGADDAESHAELEDSTNEGQEYRNLVITGKELSKDIEITWKAEAMTVEGFIDFLLKELATKMAKARVNQVIYGNGKKEASGITLNLDKTTGKSAIDLIKVLLGQLPNTEEKNFRAGAKIYMASDVSDDIQFYKDNNGNYPYLVGGLKSIGGSNVEVDPYLKNGDIIVGDMSNYVLNFNQSLRIDKEVKVKPRRVVYGGYEILDGMARPDAFAYGSLDTTTTTQETKTTTSTTK